VALSSDGNTAIIGGPADVGDVGAAWVFTPSGGVLQAFESGAAPRDRDSSEMVADRPAPIGARSKCGNKLAGGGAWGSDQGYGVAISSDGNTAIIGGPGDNGFTGAAWVFTRGRPR
jgi:hypothetical protein